MPINWTKDVTDELSLRASPLREAWEARGPGLLMSLQRNIFGVSGSRDWPSATVTIIPRLPKGGAGGEIDVDKSIVYINAVLANPLPQLPEVVRLGWLIGRIGIEASPSQRATHALALVPAILDSAADVDLARCDRPTVALALETWILEYSSSLAVEPLADVLWRWWTDTSAATQRSEASSSRWAERVAQLAVRLDRQADSDDVEQGEDS